MVSKLIKHEIKRTGRWLLIIGLGSVLGVGVLTLGGLFLPAPLGPLLGVLGVVLSIAMTFVVPLLLGLDFYRSGYQKTGYLTHAIPVKGSTIFWVKFGWASVMSVTFLVLGSALALVAGMGVQGSPSDYWEAVFAGLRIVRDFVPWWLLLGFVLFFLALPVIGLAQHYFAAAVGSEGWINRLGFGGVVLTWFLYYVAQQIASMVGILLPLSFLITDKGLDYVANVLPYLGTEQPLLPLGAFVAMALLAIVAVVWAKRSFDRRVELR